MPTPKHLYTAEPGERVSQSIPNKGDSDYIRAFLAEGNALADIRDLVHQLQCGFRATLFWRVNRVACLLRDVANENRGGGRGHTDSWVVGLPAPVEVEEQPEYDEYLGERPGRGKANARLLA